MVVANIATETGRYTYALEVFADATSSLLWITAEVEAPYYGYIAKQETALPLMGENLPTLDGIAKACREALATAYRSVTGERPRNLQHITALGERAANEIAFVIAMAVAEGMLPNTLLDEKSPCVALSWLVMR